MDLELLMDGRTDGQTTVHVQDWGNSCHCSGIVAIMHQSIVTMPPPQVLRYTGESRGNVLCFYRLF